MMKGSFWLKAKRVSLFFFLETTDWMQIALYLLTFKSNTKTFPSVVTAAKTVLESGAHFTSPTLAPKSKMNRGSLGKQTPKVKYEHFRQKPSYLRSLVLPNFNSPITTTRREYIGVEFIKIHAMNRQIMCVICHQILWAISGATFKDQAFLRSNLENFWVVRMEYHASAATFFIKILVICLITIHLFG